MAEIARNPVAEHLDSLQLVVEATLVVLARRDFSLLGNIAIVLSELDSPGDKDQAKSLLDQVEVRLRQARSPRG